MLIDFVLPGGWIDPQGTRHVTGTLRAINGVDEEWARTLPASTPRPVFITGLLRRCVTRLGGRRVTARIVRELTVGDRDYLALRLYQTSFRDTLAMVLTCPRGGCGAKLDLVLNIEDIPVESRAVQRSYTLKLDVGQEPSQLEYRTPCGGDQEALLGVDAGTAVEHLLGACLGGTAVDALPASARAMVVAAIEEQSPRVETEMEANCPECGHAFDAELDCTALLVDELRRSRAAFDREIHLLASNYHWPLRELLSLTRAGRARYLSLIGAHSQPLAN
jgi:hypothetical protein